MRRWLASTLTALSPWPTACTDDAVVGVGVADTSANAADTWAPEIATPDAQVAEVADTSTLPDTPAALDAPDVANVADAPDTKFPDTTPDAPTDIALPDPTTCGDGVCAGEETVPNCPADCGFLTNRYAGPCTKPGSWDGCPEGYVCVARSAKGGGNVCTADFEGWAPIGDSHPASDFEEFGEYDVDKKTGLSWAKAEMEVPLPLTLTACTTQTYGGFEDWRIPTQGELLSLLDYSVHSPASSLPGAKWDLTTVTASGTPHPYGNVSGRWLTALSDGLVNLAPETASGKPLLRCVRHPEATLEGSGERTLLVWNGTAILDRLSGLRWVRGANPKGNWAAATLACDSNLAGLPGTGWRLPTAGELRQMFDRQIGPAADALFGAEAWGGWSATPAWTNYFSQPGWNNEMTKWVMVWKSSQFPEDWLWARLLTGNVGSVAHQCVRSQ